jgi:hypothetical protein
MVHDSGPFVSIRVCFLIFVRGLKWLKCYRCRVVWVTLLFQDEGFRLDIDYIEAVMYNMVVGK